MLASGSSELISLGAVVPFLAVLTDPNRLWQVPLVQWLADRSMLTSPTQLLLPVTILFAISAVTAAIIRLFNLWLIGRLSTAIGSDLSCEAYYRTLCQPYDVHVRSNSSTVITGITSQIGRTVNVINNMLQVLTASFVAIGLLLGLLIINPSVALTAICLFASAYTLLAIATRKELSVNGQKISSVSKQHLQALQEGLGAIRDVLLDSTQLIYLNIYRSSDRSLRRLQAKNTFISAFPRYALEALGLVSLAFLGWFLVSYWGTESNILPLLGALALGAQRLLPALQQIYAGWASIGSNQSAIAHVLGMLDQPLPFALSAPYPFVFRESICFAGVTFTYGLGQPDVLLDLNLTIRQGERIGVIGTTGSGKSTMVDIVMGLLRPTSGCIFVDGKNLYDSASPELLSSWRAAIAHVPQSIFLTDSSIAENIALGVPKDEIDLDRVKQAAHKAQIDNFIEANQGGYNANVGERGIRLSGGQRQRIGIARALYKRASILVFDEATSALDIETEDAVMASLDALANDLTIIMVAHRLTTVQRCDRLVCLKDGHIVNDGPPSIALSAYVNGNII